MKTMILLLADSVLEALADYVVFVRRRNDDGQFNPDGRDFSQQPGMTDFVWQLSCMHSFLTYVSWMKSAEAHGPSFVFYNWDDENDIPHNEWLVDDIF